MPLTKRNPAAANQTTYGQGNGAQNFNPTGYVDPSMNNYATEASPTNTMPAGAAGYPQPGYDQGPMAPAANPTGAYGPDTTGLGQDYYSTSADPAIPPTNHIPPMHQTTIDGTPVHPRDQKTGSLKFQGKLEHTMGALLCNSNMKQKGIMKEEQARAIQQQTLHLTEAERLEEEALRRRDRAVQHGAHPANRSLGGGQASLSNDAPTANNYPATTQANY